MSGSPGSGSDEDLQQLMKMKAELMAQLEGDFKLSPEEEESDEEEDLDHDVIEESEAVKIIGERDVEGRLHGECEIHYGNGDYFWGHLHHGCKQGTGRLVLGDLCY